MTIIVLEGLNNVAFKLYFSWAQPLLLFILFIYRRLSYAICSQGSNLESIEVDLCFASSFCPLLAPAAFAYGIIKKNLQLNMVLWLGASALLGICCARFIGCIELEIFWYTLAYLSSFFACYELLLFISNRDRDFGITRGNIGDVARYLIIGVMSGGRMGEILLYRHDVNDLVMCLAILSVIAFLLYLLDVLQIRRYVYRNKHVPYLECYSLFTLGLMLYVGRGGMSFFGGLVGVLVAARMLHINFGLNFIKLVDFLALCAPMAILAGRLANFLNQELYGLPTSGNWGIVFVTDPSALPRHPSQLYEAFFEGVCILIVNWLCYHTSGAKVGSGIFVRVFALCYPLARIFCESFRCPDVFVHTYPLGMSMGQMLSASMLTCGVAFFVFNFYERRA